MLDSQTLPDTQVAIALLAAGRGSRLGGSTPKPLVQLGGRSLLDYALTSAWVSGLKPVFLVVGYQSQVLANAWHRIPQVYNPDWEEGIASSLRAAITAVSPIRSIDALCIGLADQPLIGPDAYRRLVNHYRRGAAIAVATYRGVRGNPVLLARSLWPEALKLTGDQGARQLMQKYSVTEVVCDGTGDPVDVDTQSDLAALKKLSQFAINDRSEMPTVGKPELIHSTFSPFKIFTHDA